MKSLAPCALAVLLAGLTAHAETPAIRWQPEADMDRQLYPSLIIATASRRPGADDDKPSPDLLGDHYGLLGVSVRSAQAGTRVKVTIRDNEVLNASSWEGALPQGEHTYYVAPQVSYKYDALRRVRQQRPLSVQFEVEINGMSAGMQSETVTLRSINDCPYAVRNAETTLAASIKNKPDAPPKDPGMHSASDSALGWMFAAYVNEDHPIIDTLLNEALHTGIIRSVDGYQDEKPEEVLRQAFAVWKVLQDRGVRYSDISMTPGGGEKVTSQYVRFVEESLRHQQANCVDGSVLFASVLRKMGLAPFLVIVPRHMYVGVALSPRDDDDSAACIETTLLGTGDLKASLKAPDALAKLEGALDEGARANAAWRTFRTAVSYATALYTRDKAKFDDDTNPDYQIIDVADARADGVMPIPFDRPDAAPGLPGGPTHPNASPKPLPTPFAKPPSANRPAPRPAGTPEEVISSTGWINTQPGRTPPPVAARPVAAAAQTPGGGTWWHPAGGTWWHSTAGNPAETPASAPRFAKPIPRHAPTPAPSARPDSTPRKDGDFNGFFEQDGRH